MKAVIYARVSSESDRQCTDRQVSDLKSYAQLNGIEVLRVFTEHVSGAKRNEDRAVLVECFEYCKANNVGMILFSELSRLSRNVWELLKFVGEANDSRISCYFQKENFRTLRKDGKIDAMGALFITALGIGAEMERENIKYRLQSGMREAVRKNGGKQVSGRKKGQVKTRAQKEEQYREVIALLRKGVSCPKVLAFCKGQGIKAGICTIRKIRREFVVPSHGGQS